MPSTLEREIWDADTPLTMAMLIDALDGVMRLARCGQSDLPTSWSQQRDADWRIEKAEQVLKKWAEWRRAGFPDA